MSEPIVHMVAIAKNEELYIENWCRWYLRLGYDMITIYDNNTDKTTLPETIKNSKLLANGDKQRINIIPWDSTQNLAYEHYWKHYEFDWLSINDIDEFLYLSPNETIKDYVKKYPENLVITITLKDFGDSDIVAPSDEELKIPVNQRLTKSAKKRYEFLIKSIFNKRLIDSRGIRFMTTCGHFLRMGTEKVKQRVNDAFIKHFRTYTIKEYCLQKLHVRKQCFEGGDMRRCLPSLYFFKINSKTPEKLKYIENYRKSIGMIYTLYVCSKETYDKNYWLHNRFCYVIGNPFGIIKRLKKDFRFEGILSLKEIIDDFDNVVFLGSF